MLQANNINYKLSIFKTEIIFMFCTGNFNYFPIFKIKNKEMTNTHLDMENRNTDEKK